MAEEKAVCPKCGCFVAGEGYEKAGTVYCCRPCAMDQECECGCCEEVAQPEEELLHNPPSPEGS